MARNDIKNSSLLKTKFLIYAFNGRTIKNGLQLGDLSNCNPLIVMLKCNFHLNVYK